jgi:hypothetical protein
MKKPTFLTGVGVGLAIIGVGAYIYFKRNTKKAFAKVIILKGNTTGGIQTLINVFDKDFLKEWARASRNNNNKFVVNGKTYNTKGGRASTT